MYASEKATLDDGRAPVGSASPGANWDSGALQDSSDRDWMDQLRTVGRDPASPVTVRYRTHREMVGRPRAPVRVTTRWSAAMPL